MNDNANLVSNDNRSKNVDQRNNSGTVTGASLSLSSSSTSSSSSSSNSGESTASDLGVIMETDELLTPTSPTTSVGCSTVACSTATATTTTNVRSTQEPIFNTSLTSAVFVQQLALRLAETLNRMSNTASNMASGDDDPDSVLSSRQLTLPRPDPVVAHVLLRWLRPYGGTRVSEFVLC